MVWEVSFAVLGAWEAILGLFELAVLGSVTMRAGDAGEGAGSGSGVAGGFICHSGGMGSCSGAV